MERTKRRWWTVSVTVLASLVLAGAVLSGLFQLAVLALPGYREQLSNYISRVAGRPIVIGGVALGWSGLAPRLELNDVVLYTDDPAAAPALSAERLRIGFGLLRLLRGDTFPDHIELSGLNVVVEIDAHNRVRLRGLDSAGGVQPRHDWSRELSRFDALVLEDCAVTVEDARLGAPLPLRLLRAGARRRSGGVALDASLELPEGVGETVEFEGRLDGDPAEPASLQGRWSAAVENLSRLPWLEARLPGRPRLQFRGADLTAAGAIEQGRFETLDLQIEAEAVAGQREAAGALLRDLRLIASGRRSGSGWIVEVPELRLTGGSGPWAARLRVGLDRLRPEAGGGFEVTADADYLRVQDLLPWATLFGRGPPPALRQVSGELRGLVAHARLGVPLPTYSLRAQLQAVALPPQERVPGFSGIAGELSASESGGRLSLSAQAFELLHPEVFERSLPFERLDGRLEWARDGAGWRIELPEFGWETTGARGAGDMQLRLAPGESPQLRLGARFSSDDVLRLKPYMPRDWGQNLRNWLDRAIVAGRVPAAELRLEGRFSDFPFRAGRGLFSLGIDVADGTLAYAPGWPAAERVAARLRFENGGLVIDGAGRLSGNRVERLHAEIAQFHDARLSLEGEVEGEAARFYDFLRASPLAPRLAGLLGRTRVSGPAAVTVSIGIPLHDARQTQVAGRALLKGVELQYGGLDEPFRDIEGELAFDNQGVAAQGLSGRLYDVPATAALIPLGKGVTRLEAGFDYAVRADGAGLSRYVPVFLRPRLPGASHWRAEVLLGGRDAAEGLRLSSDLRGTAVELPAPLGKPAAAAAPLTLTLRGSEAAALRLGVSYDGRLGADVVFLPGPEGLRARRALLRLGSGEVPEATEDGLRIIGEVADFELSPWIAALAQDSVEAPSAEGLRLEGVQLQAGRLQLQGHAVEKVQLAYRPEPDGWTAILQGEGADGELRWTRAPAPHLQGRFRRLSLSARQPAAAGASPQSRDEPIDPARLPTLDFDCQALRLGDARLGRLRLATSRIDGGQEIQLLDLRGGELALNAEGAWLRRAGASSGRLSFKAEGRDPSKLLRALGYADNVSAQRSRFEGDLLWLPRAPGLEWARAQGWLELDLEGGTLRALEPGAGRVLGLINFYALPRRLTLDFSDVVSKGLAFDRVRGSFQLDDGNAVTRDLNINGPSLKMELRGRVGLVARDYDQRVTVYPDVSAGVTLGVLLLGGPAAGALALIAQEVLDKPLDQATQLSYRVTGSWDNPQITRGDGAPLPRPAAAPAPAVAAETAAPAQP